VVLVVVVVVVVGGAMVVVVGLITSFSTGVQRRLGAPTMTFDSVWNWSVRLTTVPLGNPPSLVHCGGLRQVLIFDL
jgi:hypothetical protein